MNFKWAVEMLEAGRKVRRKLWQPGIYLWAEDNGYIHCSDGKPYFFTNHFKAEDWEEEFGIRFTETQKAILEQIEKLLDDFPCNEQGNNDCSDNCPFKIKGESPIHKYSKGCLHKKLFDLMRKK
jgi:hypothetical protein